MDCVVKCSRWPSKKRYSAVYVVMYSCAGTIDILGGQRTIFPCNPTANKCEKEIKTYFCNTALKKRISNAIIMQSLVLV